MEKIKILILLFIFFITNIVFGENFYSKNNEIKFINFLYSIGDYQRVINESLRVINIYNDKDKVFYNFAIKGYLKLKKYEPIINLIKKGKLPYNDTLFYALFKLKKYNLLMGRKAENPFQTKILFATYLINGKLDKTKGLFHIISQENDSLSLLLKKNYIKLSQFREKSPLLAGIMSAIIPGTGKMYANRWADGFFAMLYILGLFYKTYYTYDKHGFDSFETFLWGGLSLYFYIGDIYGSVAAVKFRKRDFLNKIEHEIQLSFTIAF